MTKDTAPRVLVVDDEPSIDTLHDKLAGLTIGGDDYERFFRSDPSRSRDTGGAGLGLAIVASIVKAHGGSVEVGRGQMGGALFRVVLQLRRSCWPTQALVPCA